MGSKLKLAAAAVAALALAADLCSALWTPAPSGDLRWAVKMGTKVDRRCNVIIKVARIPVESSGVDLVNYPLLGVQLLRSHAVGNVLYAYRPWEENISGLIKEAFASETTQRMAKAVEELNPGLECPHSLQIVFENYGPYGERTVSVADLAQVVPNDWPADFLVNQQKGRLIVINNQRGSGGLKYYPGPTINAGVTAWVYSRADDKLLKIIQKRRDELVITKPGSNVDIARDWVPADQHPRFAEDPKKYGKKFRRGFLSFAHAALRTLSGELGLSPEAQERVRQSGAPKLAGVEYWTRNPLSPSANFQVLFTVDDASVLGDLAPSAADNIADAVWMEPEAAEAAAIENAWELEGGSEYWGNMRMGPSPDDDDDDEYDDASYDDEYDDDAYDDDAYGNDAHGDAASA